MKFASSIVWQSFDYTDCLLVIIQSILSSSVIYSSWEEQILYEILNKITSNKYKQKINRKHIFYYCNYKTDENILKRIIKNNTKTFDGGKLQMLIYY